MNLIKLLIIDDETDALHALEIGLKSMEYDIAVAASVSEALAKIKKENPDLVITDLKLKDGDGLEILNFIEENYPLISVIVMTAFGSVDTALKAIRGGAIDYIQKPFRMQDLKRIISRIAENINLRKEIELLKGQLAENVQQNRFIGKSAAIHQIIKTARQVASAQSSILITGESGTGKEVLAQYIHNYSPRSNGPFVDINCGAIPENLMEAELFGFEKGAFTGANRQKRGKLELANNGTLFLDEIGELPKALQVKLLRVLQNGEFDRLGSTDKIKVNLRIITATNRDLEEMIDSGEFREDLYYRLNVISFHLPPLRERAEDIPLLTQHFIQKYNQFNQKNIVGLEPEVLEAMTSYFWKGNIRELENMIERAIVISSDALLKLEHFPVLKKSVQHATDAVSFEVGMALTDIEREVIENTLKNYNYDKTKTAKTLKIGLATLYRKIKEYGIEEKSA